MVEASGIPGLILIVFSQLDSSELQYTTIDFRSRSAKKACGSRHGLGRRENFEQHRECPIQRRGLGYRTVSRTTSRHDQDDFTEHRLGRHGQSLGKLFERSPQDGFMEFGQLARQKRFPRRAEKTTEILEELD